MNKELEMTEVKPIAVTQHYVACPWCGKNTESTIDHLLDNEDTQVRWYCHACGEKIAIRFKAGKVFVGKVPGAKLCNSLVLLRHGDIALVVKGLKFQENLAGDSSYYYNEHTCPTNYMRDVKVIINLRTGETDPHGIFKYVKEVPYDPAIEECISDDRLAKILQVTCDDLLKLKNSPD